MDYIVHIDDVSIDAKPITIHLLPGEETIFNLKIVNHGLPSNIFMDIGGPLVRSVRLKKRNHYVAVEETIPILAKMPVDKERLDGELRLKSSAGSSIIPVTLITETENAEGLSEEPWIDRNEELNEELREINNQKIDGLNEYEDVVDYIQNYTENEEGLGDAKRIEFSNDEDLENYKSASLPKNIQTDLLQPLNNQEESKGHDKDLSPEGKTKASDMILESRETERRRKSLFDTIDQKGSQLIIPSIIFVALIFVIALTFFTQNIPEFLGALISSMLIVTLIIYGAAMLLKA